MAAPAAQLLFAAEVVAFLVCLSGASLMGRRPGLLNSDRRTAGALFVGLALTAAAAFVHGAVQPDAVAPPAAVGLRLAGGLVLIGGAVSRWGWGTERRTRALVAAGGLAQVAAGGAAFSGSVYAEEALVAAGGLALAAALVMASRRSIGPRLTASVGATLLVVVVVLSVAVSTILSGTVRDDALRRLQSRGAALATTVATGWEADLADAKLVAASVEGLGVAEGAATGAPAGDAAVQSALGRLSTQFFADVGIVWVAPSGRLVAASPGMAQAIGAGVAEALAGSNLVSRTITTRQPAGTAGVAAGRPLEAAVYPDVPADRLVGVAVVVSGLDRRFLSGQVRDDPSLAAFLVGGGNVLSSYDPGSAPGGASGGRSPLPRSVVRLASAASPTGAVDSVGGRFFAVEPVPGGDGRTVMYAVVETSTLVVDSVRRSLFRTLFLVALGGSIIAFLLSVLVTDPLNRGLLMLTRAARRITGGERGVRTGISSGDEIGVLAGAFDLMAGSIEDQAAALRTAAQEEAAVRARLQSVIAGMGEALVAVDAGGTVTELNHAAERLLGVRRPEAVGHPARDVLDIRLEDGRAFAAAVSAGRRASGDGSAPALRAAGMLAAPEGPVPVAVSIGVPAGAEDTGGAVVVLRDLRPEQEIERMKTEFLSRVGHELRTPLTAILGYSQLLSSRDVPVDRARLWHSQILEQSQRLLRTVEMLEFFASAGGNRLGLETVEVPPADLVDDVVRRWEQKIGPGRVQAAVPAGLPVVDVDRRWIDLALDELLDNAVKFSPAGARVTVGAARRDPGWVTVTVTDRGKGMTPEEQGAAFAEFVQGDTSDTRRYGGLGLGLPLVSRVAEAHGGKVECASEPGRGSRLSLVLPLPGATGNGRRPASGIPESRGPTS